MSFPTDDRKPGKMMLVGSDDSQILERRFKAAGYQVLTVADTLTAIEHAALLMVDFLLSPDGQAVLRKFYYGSATEAQPFEKWRPEHGLKTEQYEKKLSHWDDLLNLIAHK